MRRAPNPARNGITAGATSKHGAVQRIRGIAVRGTPEWARPSRPGSSGLTQLIKVCPPSQRARQAHFDRSHHRCPRVAGRLRHRSPRSADVLHSPGTLIERNFESLFARGTLRAVGIELRFARYTDQSRGNTGWLVPVAGACWVCCRRRRSSRFQRVSPARSGVRSPWDLRVQHHRGKTFHLLKRQQAEREPGPHLGSGP